MFWELRPRKTTILNLEPPYGSPVDHFFTANLDVPVERVTEHLRFQKASIQAWSHFVLVSARVIALAMRRCELQDLGKDALIAMLLAPTANPSAAASLIHAKTEHCAVKREPVTDNTSGGLPLVGTTGVLEALTSEDSAPDATTGSATGGLAPEATIEAPEATTEATEAATEASSSSSSSSSKQTKHKKVKT